jgi:putative inorganic carbon (HCO3(-)) transporter
MLAVAFMGGVWLWLRRGLIVALVLGGSGLAVLQMLPSRLQELDAGEESAAGRVEAWYEGLQMFQGQPLFGVGAGNFTEHNYLTAHNSFVLVLAETGFIGYIIWLAFVGYCFRMMYLLCRYAPALTEPSEIAEWRAERRIGMTLFIALCGFFAAAFFLSRSYVIVLYILAAMVVADYALVSRRHPDLPRFRISSDIVRWLVISTGSIAALFVIVKVLL